MESNSPKINIGRDFDGNLVIGNIQGDVIAGNTNNSSQETKNIFEIAVEIQQIIQTVEQSHPSGSSASKRVIAAETIDSIENHPRLRQRVLSALQAGGTQALAQALNHPLSSFIIAALEDWQKNQK